MRDVSTIEVKIKHEKREGFRVFTSRNGNGAWAVGVPFRSREAAVAVARVLFEQADAQGDAVTWLDEADRFRVTRFDGPSGGYHVRVKEADHSTTGGSAVWSGPYGPFPEYGDAIKFGEKKVAV